MEDSHKKDDRKESVKTILIAEEEYGTRLLLKEELELEGYRILTSDSVSTAYKILQEEQMIDLYIVSSIKSGDELNIRFKERKPNLKIILYSSHRCDILNHPRFDDCVLKSSDLTELINSIKRLIG